MRRMENEYCRNINQVNVSDWITDDSFLLPNLFADKKGVAHVKMICVPAP